MPDLSACYFCGAAADATVREYDVVPDAADESLRSTATLCDGCRSKLEIVLSSVVRGARPSDEPVDVELALADAPDDAAASTPSLDVETEDILAAADRGPEEAEDGSATGGDADGASSSGAASSDALGDDPLGSPADDSTGASPTDGIAFDDGANASDGNDAGAEAGTASSGGETDAASSGDGVGTAPNDGATASGGGSSSSGSSDADVERPDSETYNRVVRLLQNREFPVNRSEFSDLASSAYDIPADECAQVIDYAIHRGELVEDRGMLKKP